MNQTNQRRDAMICPKWRSTGSLQPTPFKSNQTNVHTLNQEPRPSGVMNFVLPPVKTKCSSWDGLASSRLQPRKRIRPWLYLFGLIGLCSALQWPSAVKANPWDDDRPCVTRTRWGRPVLVCEEEYRDQRWGSGRQWQDSRWNRDQPWGSDPDRNEAWRWNRAQRRGSDRDWNPSRWNQNQRWGPGRSWQDSRWSREETWRSEPDWSNSRWILYP